MPNRVKVINKVTAIVADMQEEVDEWKDYSDSELRNGLTCDCDWWYKTLQTLKDALALLKAQEPIAPIQGADDHDEYIFCCGSCGAVVGETFLGPSGGGEVREKYCPECGRAVKWE